MQIHDEIVKNVDLLLKLNDDLKNETLQSRVQQIEARIDHSEERINELVFQLYGLSQSDRKTIETIEEN